MRLAALVSIALASLAHAMPADLPWQRYLCDGGKALDLKFLSDGLAIGVRLDGDDETTLTLVPADADKQAGFRDGDYKGEGDTLLVLNESAVTLTGSAVAGAPYADCRSVPLPPIPPG